MHDIIVDYAIEVCLHPPLDYPRDLLDRCLGHKLWLVQTSRQRKASCLLLVSSLSPNAGGVGQKKEAYRESQHHLHWLDAHPSCDYHNASAVRLNMANWMSRNAHWGQSHGQPHWTLIRALPARKRHAATCRPKDLVDCHSQLTRVGGGVLNQLASTAWVAE